MGLQVRNNFPDGFFGNVCSVRFDHLVYFRFPIGGGQRRLHGDVARTVAGIAMDLDILAAITGGKIENRHRISRNLIDGVW